MLRACQILSAYLLNYQLLNNSNTWQDNQPGDNLASKLLALRFEFEYRWSSGVSVDDSQPPVHSAECSRNWALGLNKELPIAAKFGRMKYELHFLNCH